VSRIRRFPMYLRSPVSLAPHAPSNMRRVHKLSSNMHGQPVCSVFLFSQVQNILRPPHPTVVNWKRGGRCLHVHRIPVIDPDSGVVTSVALDADWLVAGLANHRIHIFSTHTGSLVRTLVGHELGVWAVDLVSRGGALDPSHPQPPPHNSSGLAASSGGIPEVVDGPSLLLHNRAPAGAQVLDPQGLDHLLPPSMRAVLALDAQYPPTVHTYEQEDGPIRPESARSDVAGATRGWGQPGALVVSGGCDKDVRVWDVRTGCVPMSILVSGILIREWAWIVSHCTSFVDTRRRYAVSK
jgi:WD40 repeat protein